MNTLTRNPKVLQFVNVASFVLVLSVNYLSNALPLNGRTAGEISDALPSYFTPAGYTFSIWGVIYLALFAFIVYQSLPSQRTGRVLQQVGWLFAASSVANVAWLFSWHYGYYLLSVVFMVSLLISLIAIYLRLQIGSRNPRLTRADKWFAQIPFSLYLGWITVATIANIASVAAYLGWVGLGIPEPTWSAIMMIVATVVAGILLFNRRNFSYAAVLIWALFGIRANHPQVAIVANTAVVSALLIAILAIVGYVRTRQRRDRAEVKTRPA
jgi:hypothetical protein